MTRELLRDLATEDGILIRVQGERGVWDFELIEQNRTNLQWFLDRASSHAPPRTGFLFHHPLFLGAESVESAENSRVSVSDLLACFFRSER